MRKYTAYMTGLLLLLLLMLSGCSKAVNTTSKDSSTITPSPAVIDNKAEDSHPAGSSELTPEATVAPTEALENTINEDVNYDPDFKVILEAEEASFTGKVRVESIKEGYTGTGYLTGIESDADTITFTLTVPGSGAYDLNFVSAGNVGHKENNVLVDGVNIGLSVVDKNEFTDAIMERIYLTAGEHQITMTKSWGWIFLDSLIVTASEPADMTIFDVSSELVDKKATDRTKRLMQYLADMYGEYIISGQYGDLGLIGAEFSTVYDASGKYPAMMGLDMIEYSPSRVAHGSSSIDVEHAINFDKEGGIVTFAWHWNAPEPYLKNSDKQPWWRGFYTDATTIDLKKIMDGEDEEGYELLLSDIDAIAIQLKRLQDADVPVLWRPLHEASGGWFWWGASGSEPYIKLYRLLFERLTDYHDLHNLIWVWNGQSKEWYPGDEYVDIVGIDIYPGERVYQSQVSKFNELVDWNGENKKIIALTENGCLFDPDLAVRDNAMWSYFGTWEGEFILTEKYNEKEMIKKVYNSDKVITLDELPDLKTYGY